MSHSLGHSEHTGSCFSHSVSSCPDALQKWDDFFQALKVNESLRCPDLTDNKLWAKGAKLLCKTWKQPKSKLQRVS